MKKSKKQEEKETAKGVNHFFRNKLSKEKRT
jgi:alpha/beta superfamily hydrolase